MTNSASKTNQTLGGGGFHHVALRVRDFNRSVEFYTRTLGFKPKITWGEKPSRGVLLDTGDGNYFELFERPNQAAPPAEEGVMLHVAIRTTDCDAAVERVRAAGAEITMEPKNVDIASTPVTKIRIAFFKGPDGEVIEFFQNEAT